MVSESSLELWHTLEEGLKIILTNIFKEEILTA